MFSYRSKVASLALLLLFAITQSDAAGPKYAISTLASFDGANGAWPAAGLTLGTDRNLYGTTEIGGNSNFGPDYNDWGNGTIFKIDPATGVLTSIFSFQETNGKAPIARLTPDRSGGFYGTTSIGGWSPVGYGTVFHFDPTTNSLDTLFAFNANIGNGSQPYSGVILDADGILYGTTRSGSSSHDNGGGTVYKLNPATGAFTTLFGFDSYSDDVGYFSNGIYPRGDLLLHSDGQLYGTNWPSNAFRLGTDGHNFTILTNLLHGDPAGLVAGPDGLLYVTSPGSGEGGAIHSINPLSGETTAVALSGDIGLSAPLVLGPDGNMYGTTSVGGKYGQGTVFRLDLPSGELTTLASFKGSNGDAPDGGLLFGEDGNLYGTTRAGGTAGWGTVFKLSVVPEPGTLLIGLLTSISFAFVRVRSA